jgi:ATP-dependent Clp protease adaptor protein ClpS
MRLTIAVDRIGPVRSRIPRRRDRRHNEGVSQVIEAPVEVRLPEGDEDYDHDRPWVVIVWNDPINLMSYVTFVLRKLFGYSEAEATKLMLQVHNEGKAVVSSGTKEKAEFDVARLHGHGLWATLRQD